MLLPHFNFHKVSVLASRYISLLCAPIRCFASSFIIAIYVLFLCWWHSAVCTNYIMVCSPFFFICSYRTGIALRCNRRHHQRDSDRVHHQRASSWGLTSGSQDSCTGFWRWHMLTFHRTSASLWFSLILSVFDNWVFPLRMLYININNDITLVSHCNKSLLHCSF